MRTLKLTHEEIQLIEVALQHFFVTRMDIVEKNVNFLESKINNQILDVAKEAESLRRGIVNSEKDL